MIRIENLSFQYSKDRVLSFPNFSSGTEPLLILGPSGSGKTTLLHLMAGILMPLDGAVYWQNELVNSLSKGKIDTIRGKEISIIFQKPHFIHALNVEENIKIQALINNKTIDQNEFKAFTERLNISHLLAKKTNELSQGEKQRITIARALVCKPKYLLADEPSAALDDKNTAEVLDLLCNETNKIGSHLVIITHDQRVKDKISKRIQLV